MPGARRPRAPERVVRKKAALFCKKARKRRLLIWDWGVGRAKAPVLDSWKFFGSFFQKRTAFFFQPKMIRLYD
jgi:hypothetical protein